MEKSFWKELWLLLIITFLFLIILGIFFFIELIITGGAAIDDVFSLHIVQWLQTILVMFLPPIIWYKWRVKQNPFVDFGFSRINWKFVFFAVIFVLISIPAFEVVALLSSYIPLPASIETAFEEAALQNFDIMGKLLSPDGFFGWLEVILLVSIATAIGEETMFRGALFKCFGFTNLNLHWIAILTGLIFAIIHFEPAGFFIRWILGSMLCYFVVWSGSIWPAIIAHAVNNLCAVIQFKCFDIGNPHNEEYLELTFGWTISIISIVATFFFVYIMYKNRIKE